MDAWEGKEIQRTFGSVTPPGSAIQRNLSPPSLDRLTENGSQTDHAMEGGDSSSESSDSASSNSSSTTSESSTSNSTTASNGLYSVDEYGEHLNVSCANNEGKMYLNRFARGSRGRCVLFRGRWITPNEFQAISGRQSSKDWKRSIRLKGRCLKDYISQGLFKEHVKSCSCKICIGGDSDLLKQEGEMALAAKRRRLSQTDGGGGSAPPLQSGPEATPTATEGTSEGKLPGAAVGVVKKKRRGRPPKIQRVWSPSGEVAQEVSSNDEENKPADNSLEMGEDTVIDSSDFLPRRSRRAVHRKHVGHRTELGTFTRKPREWDTEEVAEFMRLQGFSNLAERFQENDIDGQSLFMLKEQHLIEQFDMKLGPALRLLDTISRLRHPPLQT